MNMKLFWILGANPDIVPNGSRVPWSRRARSSSEHQVPSGRLRRSVRSQTAVHPLDRRIARTGGVLSLHMGRRYAKIMARKQASELARVKLFARYGKRIVQTAKAGGDVDAIVREAIERGVPKENVARALTKASASEQANFESAIYELFGPHGVGILVEALTDNLNRTAAEVRLVARKAGLQMASAGAVQHLFERKGCIRAFVSEEDAESLTLIRCFSSLQMRALTTCSTSPWMTRRWDEASFWYGHRLVRSHRSPKPSQQRV
jgi:hypothetical protein